MLGYQVTLSPRRRGRDTPTVCNTTHTQCNFSAPAGTRRVYLSAYNAAGESAATEVILLERKGEGSANLLQSKTSACPPGALHGGEHLAGRPTGGAPEQAARRVLSQGGEQGRQGWGAQGGDVSGSLPSPIVPAGCPHAGQPLARLQAVPGGEHSFWVRWEAPPAPVAAYVLEWQRVASEPGGCSTCWQMERDGAATAALIQGKLGAAGGVPALLVGCVPVGGVCTRGLAPLLTAPGANPAPNPLLTLPPSSGPTPGVRHRGRHRAARGSQQPGTLSSRSPEPWPPPLLSVADGIEPFQRYNISVYPLYKDTVGVPIHTAAYSKQKGTCAPSSCPRGPGGLASPHPAFACQKGE